MFIIVIFKSMYVHLKNQKKHGCFLDNMYNNPSIISIMTVYRVRTVMKNLEKSWNFKTAFSRPGKVLEK